MNEMTEKASWSPKSFVVAQVKQKGFVVAHELRGRSGNESLRASWSPMSFVVAQ